MSAPVRPYAKAAELPPVDARLVAPESRYEIQDGSLVYVSPADEPHGSRHSKISALLEAHVGDEWDVASDMLTRTSETSDVAPDVSVFARERDEQTGGRKLEELAFEVVSTERLSHAGAKAQKLTDRGVRRVFAVDVGRQRAFEWSRPLSTWELLAPDSAIEDRTLGAPLPVQAVVQAAKADDAIAHALLAKGNRVLSIALAETRSQGRVEGKAEGKAEAVIAVLHARGIATSELERARILAEREPALLDGWLALALRCSIVSELFELTPRAG